MPRTPKYFMHIDKPFFFVKDLVLPFLPTTDLLLYEKADGMECMLITEDDTLVQFLEAKFYSLQYTHLTNQQSHIEISTVKTFINYIGNIELIKRVSTR